MVCRQHVPLQLALVWYSRSMGLANVAHVARPQLGTILVGLGLLAIATYVELRVPVVAGAILDEYTIRSMRLHGRPVQEEMSSVPTAVDESIWHAVLLFVTMAIAKHVGEYALRLAGERTVADVRVRLFRCLLGTEVSTVDGTSSASLVSVLTSDVQAVHMSLTWHLPMFLRNGCMVFIAGAHMLHLSSKLTLIGVVIAPLIGLQASLVGRIVQSIARQEQTQLGRATAIAHEGIASIRCIKAFGREGHFAGLYAAEVNKSKQLAMREMMVHKYVISATVLERQRHA